MFTFLFDDAHKFHCDLIIIPRTYSELVFYLKNVLIKKFETTTLNGHHSNKHSLNHHITT